MNNNLDEFRRYNPLTDNRKILPDSPGIYLICVKNLDSLPRSMKKLEMKSYEDLPIIYVGISHKSIRKRDYRNHFNGTGRNSTLRKSLGVLFEYEKLYFPNGRYRFVNSDEILLSSWLKDNIILFYKSLQNPSENEIKYIMDYYPPLNLAGNNNSINKEFRKELSTLRNCR